MLLRIGKSTIRLEISHIEVVRTALIRIEGNVHRIHRTRLRTISLLLTKWEQLPHVDGSHIVIAQLVEVALDMSRSQRTTLSVEKWVDCVPGHLASVESTCQSRLVLIFREHGRNAGEEPRGRSHHINTALGGLEIIQIRSVILRSARLSGNQLGKLSSKGNLRWLGKMQERNLVEHIRQPLTFLLPVDVDTPEGILHRFLSHRHLGEERLFTQMLERTAQLEILREVVFPVESKHRLAHHTIVGIAFKRNIDGCSCIDDALIENRHFTGIVIYRIVRTFGERNTTGSHHHRTLRNIVCSERNDIGRRTLELAHQQVLVLLGYLFGYRLRTVIKSRKGIFLRLFSSHALTLQIFVHITTERFYFRNEDASVGNRITLYVVVVTIAMSIVIIVKTVGSQYLDEWCLLHLLFRDIGNINPRRIALEFHVESELFLLYLGS